jgi:hypothetical protein
MNDRTWWRLAATASLAMAALAGSPVVSAQGCMSTRVSPPMIGASGEARYLQDGQWEASFIMRTYRAEEHYYGRNIHYTDPAPKVGRTTYDVSVTRMVSPRNSLTFSVPYSDGFFDRSPIPGLEGARDEASGIGDVALMFRRWARDPATHTTSNFRIGLGVKAPTGDYKQTTSRTIGGMDVSGEADVSIQPGDGGWGAILGLEMFHQSGERGVWFAEGTYILNPRGHNSHDNQQLGPGPYVEDHQTSIPDYYLVRAGYGVAEPWGWKYGSSQIGLRLEGQPVRDIIGDESGFRRPGYTLAVEPGVAYSIGTRSSIYLSVPLTIYRGRPLSVDEEVRATENQNTSTPPGLSTDPVSAAFADYNVLAGFTYRWK